MGAATRLVPAVLGVHGLNSARVGDSKSSLPHESEAATDRKKSPARVHKPLAQGICSCLSRHPVELGWTCSLLPQGGSRSSCLILAVQGKPKPRATWTHNGCALDTNRVSVRNGEQDSILFIREVQHVDSGRYQLHVQLGRLEATATIDILVIGKVRGVGGKVVPRSSLSMLKRNHLREVGELGVMLPP